MFYTSVIRSATQRALIDGPFETHQEALDAVPASRTWFCQRDPWGEFDAFGTTEAKVPVPLALMRRGVVPA